MKSKLKTWLHQSNLFNYNSWFLQISKHLLYLSIFRLISYKNQYSFVGFEPKTPLLSLNLPLNVVSKVKRRQSRHGSKTLLIRHCCTTQTNTETMFYVRV